MYMYTLYVVLILSVCEVEWVLQCCPYGYCVSLVNHVSCPSDKAMYIHVIYIYIVYARVPMLSLIHI